MKFTTKREPTNPLNPEYKLQSFTYVPPPPLKFVRDQMQHDDIEGSRTKYKKQAAVEKDVMNVKDIDGALPKQPKIRATPYDALVY